MLTTIIYRSHLCDDVPFRTLEEMVTAANLKNEIASVTGILLFNGSHFFQLLEGPEEKVRGIYQQICADNRHDNVVELLCDYAPTRRFGKVGMELFDLREHAPSEVLQTVLDKGTSRYQLAYNDRALRFFRTFVDATEKANYFAIPPADSWEFVCDDSQTISLPASAGPASDYQFAFQPIIDPLAQEIISYEALLRPADGQSPGDFFSNISGNALYEADLMCKKQVFSVAHALQLDGKTLSINLLPMTLVNVPNAVDFLLHEIAASGLVAEQIIVEFTESEVVSRLDEFMEAVKLLKAAGISVAIDHFGAGFAGLYLLAQFQPDHIKINHALIRDVHKSGPRQAIIQAIIKCCTALEIHISAVGVEQPEEWMWLESAGIEHFQGNLFAKPVLNTFPAIAWPEKITTL